jgi:hypothetical protein
MEGLNAQLNGANSDELRKIASWFDPGLRYERTR